MSPAELILSALSTAQLIILFKIAYNLGAINAYIKSHNTRLTKLEDTT